MALPFPVVDLCLLPAALGCSQPLGPRRDRVLAVYLMVASVHLLRWAVVPLTDGNQWHGPVDQAAFSAAHVGDGDP